MSGQHPKSQTTAVVLAIFLSFFTYLYTDDVDKKKFWWWLGGTIGGYFLAIIGVAAHTPVLLVLWFIGLIVGKVVPIVTAARRPSAFYLNYPPPTSGP